MFIYKFLLLLSIILSTSCVEADTAIQNTLTPLSVNKIIIKRVDEELIRVILHNSEYSHKIEIERIETPAFKRLESKIVNAITLDNGEIFPFSDDIAGIAYNKVDITDSFINILFEYFPARGNEFLADCKITIGKDNFSPMKCVKKEVSIN